MSPKVFTEFTPYSDNYKQIVKEHWYANQRIGSKKLVALLPEDEYGRKPNPQVIDNWCRNELWDFWADELDSRALAVVEDTLVAQKAEMLKRHANVGMLLVEKGVVYLVSGTFDSSSSAVAAIKAGVEIERTSRGIGDMLVKMAQMNDVELASEITKLVSRAGDNNQLVIDAEPVPEKKEEK